GAAVDAAAQDASAPDAEEPDVGAPDAFIRDTGASDALDEDAADRDADTSDDMPDGPRSALDGSAEMNANDAETVRFTPGDQNAPIRGCACRDDGSTNRTASPPALALACAALLFGARARRFSARR